MEKDATLPNDFPIDGVELRCFLVVSDYTRSLAFYRDVLGATMIRELAGILCFLSFAGSQILLSTAGGSTKDKPAVSVPPPLDRTSVISELSIWVPDCSAAYEVLRSRGAEFLTITPHVETTFHSIIHSCLNRRAHCLASNREKYEKSRYLEVHMVVLGKNPGHI